MSWRGSRWLAAGRWRWLVGAAVAVAAVWYGIRFPWLATWRTLRSSDWRLLLLAAVANLLSLCCKAGGWQVLLTPLAPARIRTTQAATLAGAAVGSVGIALSGEAARLRLVTQRDGVDTATAARTIAASRIVETAALGAFLAGVAVLSLGGDSPGRLAVAAAALAAVALGLVRWLPWLRPRAAGGRRVATWSTPRLLGATGFGLAGWMLQWATYHWSIAATRAPVTPKLSLVALLLANLGGIFRLTPGNVGVVQAAVVLGLAPAGVSPAGRVAAGLALQAVEVFPVMAIGLVILRPRRPMRAGSRLAAVAPAPIVCPSRGAQEGAAR